MLGVVLASAGIAACNGGAEARHPVDASTGADLAPRPDGATGGATGVGGTGGNGAGGGAGKEIGATCGAPGECRSGRCSDGVCCLSDCSGPCQSCAIAGTVGTCVNAPVGSDPRDDCPDDGIAGCGRQGSCDGTGSCALYAAGAICQPQSCAASTVTHAARCDGDGTCASAAVDSCGQYLCNSAGSCRSVCTTSADCVAGAACVNGSCGPKPPGAPCLAAGECASAHCEQGLCCATACSGTCKSCAIAGSEGQCIDVPSGTDPLSQCGDQGSSTCGTDGTCDGVGGCRLYAGGTVCGTATCTGALATPGRTCNGGGTCLAVLSTTCAPYACGASACKTSCTVDADCTAPNVCIGSVCGPSGAGGVGGGGAGGVAGTTGGAGGRGATGGGTAGASGQSGAGGAAGVGGSAGVTGASGASGAGGVAGSGTGGSAGGGAGGRGGAAGNVGSGGGGTGGTGCAGYVFCDDFEDGNANGWTPNGGTWSVITDGSRVYEGGNGSAMALAGLSTWTDQTVQARMKVLQFGGTSTSYRAGIVARAIDSSNLYVFALDASGAMRLLKGTSSPSGTGATGTCGKVSVGAVANTWYTLQMKIAGAGTAVRITTFLDGTPIHDCQTSIGTLDAGAIGVYTYGPNNIVEFDDVKVSTP